MASIRPRQLADGTTVYDVGYRDPSRRYRRKTFKRKVDAERFRRDVDTDVARGEWTDPRLGRETFQDWAKTCAATTVDLRKSTTARDAAYLRSLILPTFGEMSLASIDYVAAQAWVAELNESNLAPATVVKAAHIVGKIMSKAVKAKMIPANPFTLVDLPKIELDEMRFLTPDEVASLAEVIDQRYRALVWLAAYCGPRAGEMFALRPSRVDLLRRRLDIAETVVEVQGVHSFGPPKTKAGRRVVPMPKFVAAELERHLAEHPGEFVFAAPMGGPIRASQFRRRVWYPACVAAGLGQLVKHEDGTMHYSGLRLHDLRHTAVTFWIAAGASPKEVARRAGHSSVVTVLDRYGHLLPGSEEAVTDALDDLAAGARARPAAEVRAISAR